MKLYRSLAFLLACWGAVPAWGSTLTSSLSTTTARSESRPQWRGEWSLDVGFQGYSEDKDEGASAVAKLSTRFDVQFSQWLRFHGAPYVSGVSSRVQERFSDNGDENRIGLDDAYLIVEPLPYLELRAGAHSQKFLNSQIISKSRSFPGFQEILKYQSQDLNASLIFQQVIPTSRSMSTERIEREPLPWFMTQSLLLEGKNFGWLQWKLNSGFYQWSSLPAKIADESRVLGNRVAGVEGGSYFEYEHRGLFLATELCFCREESLVDFVFEFGRFHNPSVPSYYADGQVVGIGADVKWKNYLLEARVRSFLTEGEVTVAKYGSSSFGHTNRKGEQFDLDFHFKDQGFSIYSEFFRAQPINLSVYQRDLQGFEIGVKTEYATF